MATADRTSFDNPTPSEPAGPPEIAEHPDLDQGLTLRRDESLGVSPRQIAVFLLAGLLTIGGIALFQGGIPLPLLDAGQGSAVSVDNASSGPLPQIGEPAPVFSLTDSNGRSVRLSDFKGKAVLLNFWATWCPPCRAEMPDIEAIHREYGDRLTVLAVNLQEDPPVVNDYFGRLGLTFRSAMDLDGAVTSQYRIVALPTTYFIGADGRIADRNIGPMTKGLIEAKLRKVLQ